MMIGIFFIKATALENFCLRLMCKTHGLIRIRAIELKSNSCVNHETVVWTLWSASPTISRQITHPRLAHREQCALAINYSCIDVKRRDAVHRISPFCERAQLALRH